ncbi:hypothetical protein V9K67_00430 [Paraflavisolibacter sp. H34]|uniref:hypothetical protein n=1 Tax=Huijunlia imazamoxiresistens TaxID=3127457 RepID=UPI003018E975
MFYLRHLTGHSLAARLRRWKKEFQRDPYYRADTDTVYSYILPQPGERAYRVEFRIFCNHPLKAVYREDGRTTVLSRSFPCRERAERFVQAELKRATPYFRQSHFYMIRQNNGAVEQYW